MIRFPAPIVPKAQRYGATRPSKSTIRARQIAANARRTAIKAEADRVVALAREACKTRFERSAGTMIDCAQDNVAFARFNDDEQREIFKLIEAALTPEAAVAVPQYLQAFPTFGALDVVLPKGFEDQSEPKDDCPSFALFGGDDGDALMTIFVDFKNPADRREENPCRFYVVDHVGNFMRTTDEWDDVLEFVAAYRPAASALEQRQQEIEDQRAYEERFENSLESPEGGLLANIDND